MSFQPAGFKELWIIRTAEPAEDVFATRANLPQNGSCQADLDNFSLLR